MENLEQSDIKYYLEWGGQCCFTVNEDIILWVLSFLKLKEWMNKCYIFMTIPNLPKSIMTWQALGFILSADIALPISRVTSMSFRDVRKDMLQLLLMFLVDVFCVIIAIFTKFIRQLCHILLLCSFLLSSVQ